MKDFLLVAVFALMKKYSRDTKYNPLAHDPETGRRSTEYHSWANMNERSRVSIRENPNHAHKAYLDKDVEICERWKSFNLFLEDMGKKPSPQHTLDRIENSKGYSKENCRWASPVEQIDNRDCTRLITANGKTQSIARWSEETGISYEALRNRLRKKWNEHDTINTPVIKKGIYSNKKIYSQEIKNSVISALKNGKSQKELHKLMNLSQVAIAAIVKEARELGQLPPFRHK